MKLKFSKSKKNIICAICTSLSSLFLAVSGIEMSFAVEQAHKGVWSGRISCQGASKDKSRGVIFRMDGENSWLTNFGKSGETYESKLVKGKAKFKGVYKGIYNGESFNKRIRVTVIILDSGNVKVSGQRGSFSNCHGELTRNAVVEASAESPSTAAKTLNSYYRNLPGQWIGRAGGLIDRGKEASAAFKQNGETIVGQILIGNCFPSTSLVTRINGDSIIISGEKNERSFRAEITSKFGEVTETSLYIPYKIISDVSGCVKKESGFLKMKKQ